LVGRADGAAGLLAVEHQDPARWGGGVLAEALPGLRLDGHDDDLRAQGERAEGQHLGRPDAADQGDAGRLGPEEADRHRLLEVVGAEDQAGAGVGDAHRRERRR
jgi:hypothetical protein